jgi:hypothetical protein
MRFLFFILFLPCIGCGEPRAQAPTRGRDLAPRDAAHAPDDSDAVGRTHVDGADLALDLPGQWNEAPIERGHDLRKGPQEIVVVLMPRFEGLDAGSSAARLADAQQHGVTTLCKRGAAASAPTPVTARPDARRLHVTCDEPRLVATYIALTVESDVLSYEHYWYDVPGYSAALDRADDAILASLQVRCPSVVLDQASNGGACLEAALLGQSAVERCGQALESHAWKRDDTAAELIRRQTAKTLVCYRRPH